MLQLSSVQLRELTTYFNEVYANAKRVKGHLVGREAFSKYFKLPVTVGSRLLMYIRCVHRLINVAFNNMSRKIVFYGLELGQNCILHVHVHDVRRTSIHPRGGKEGLGDTLGWKCTLCWHVSDTNHKVYLVHCTFEL